VPVLVWQASSRGLPRDAFAADLASLHPSKELADVLLACYEAARAQVRRELLRGALLDHGNVLDGVDWRLNHVATSSRIAAGEVGGEVGRRLDAARGVAVEGAVLVKDLVGDGAATPPGTMEKVALMAMVSRTRQG
jgi:hypothetical protein